MTNKQRAKIYLKAAELEANEFKAGLSHTYICTEGLPYYKCFPELKMITGSIKNVSEYEIRSLRILGFLFAYEIALHP